MKDSKFFNQVELLLQVLPILIEGTPFVLKGGTAINLFLRDMPRFSVDIDLAYTAIESRKETLLYFNSALPILGRKVEQRLSNIRWLAEKARAGDIARLVFSNPVAEIKVDVNHILRGSVNTCKELELCKKAQQTFETFLSVNCLSFEDIYAGKICAALDRQHPRDLFDVKLLFENEGYTEKLRKTFIIYLVSGNRPLSEMINPNRLDIRESFEKDFLGMTMEKVSLKALLEVRETLIDLVKSSFSENERRFLVSLKAGTPEWNLLGIEGVKELPAIRWKLLNISKMAPEKRENSLKSLRNILGI